MADTKHPNPDPAGPGPVESDGISYRGIIWFIAVLAITVFVSNLLMVGAFKVFDHQVVSADKGRPPLATPAGAAPPGPNLLFQQSGSPQVSEPGNLQRFREREDAALRGYSLDKTSGAATIPIDRAKALLLERGLPTRDATAAAPAATPAKAAPPAPAGKSGAPDRHEEHDEHEGYEGS